MTLIEAGRSPDNPFAKVLSGWTEDKWIQGRMRDYPDQSRTCLIGRFRFKGLLLNNAWLLNAEIIDILGEVILEQYPMQWYHNITTSNITKFNHCVVTSFNDEKDRTFEQVTQVLEKAATRWDEKHLLDHE